MLFTVKLSEGLNITESIREFLERIIKAKKVDAVLVPKRYPDGEGVAQALITDPKKLQGTDPLAPVQIVNAAHIIVELTKDPLDKKIAAVLRPCEIRATIELIKLKQAKSENLYLIGYDCPGVYNLKTYLDLIEKENDKEGFTQKYLEQFLSADKGSSDRGDIRETCCLCTNFTSKSASRGKPSTGKTTTQTLRTNYLLCHTFRCGWGTRGAIPSRY